MSFDGEMLAALPALKRFAISLCRDEVRAEDLVQETVLRACANREKFELGTSMPAWLTTILRNHHHSAYRKIKREVEDIDGEHAENTSDGSAGADDGSIEEYAIVQKLLGTLPEKQRQALTTVSEGGSYKEAAARLGMEIGTVKSQVNRARGVLSIVRDGRGAKRDAGRRLSIGGTTAQFRKIDASVFVKPPAFETELRERPKLLWLPLTRLFIDERYQRNVAERGVTSVYAIAAHFDWKKFGCIVVAQVDDLYAIVDGQHRAYAASIRKIEELPCLVIQATTQEQAAAFAAINGKTTRINDLQVFAAAVVAQDTQAVELADVCKRAKVAVLRFPTPENLMKPRQTIAIGMLKTCLRMHGAKVLETALRCIAESNPDARGILRAPIIRAMCDVVQKLADRRPAEMLAKCEQINFQREFIEARLRGMQKSIAVRHELVDTLLPKFQ